MISLLIFAVLVLNTNIAEETEVSAESNTSQTKNETYYTVPQPWSEWLSGILKALNLACALRTLWRLATSRFPFFF
ncbi:unnamed protein product [Heterobilharzia americana]|nr:unnamed protein product [Heterobilharzia americana]CAH8607487.1 unnamed protein product [Heterobilharzia americana]